MCESYFCLNNENTEVFRKPFLLTFMVLFGGRSWYRVLDLCSSHLHKSHWRNIAENLIQYALSKDKLI